MQGSKNSYTLLGTGDATKFDFMYGCGKPKDNVTTKAEQNDDSDFSEEDEDETGAESDIQAEDVHNSTKVIL